MHTLDRQRLQRKRQRLVTLLRLGNWVIFLPRKPWSMFPVLLFFTAVGLAWEIKVRYLVLSHQNLLLKSVFQYVPTVLFVSVAVLLFGALLMALSTPRFAQRHEDALLKIDLTAHDGTAPALIAKNRIKNTNVCQLVFYSLGVSREVWMRRRSEIEDALNLRIVGEVCYGGRNGVNRNIIVLTVVRGVGDRKAGVLYDDEL